MIAYKPFSQAPAANTPVGIPSDYPWVMRQLREQEDISKLKKEGWIILTDIEYEEHIASLSERYLAWETARTQLGIEGVVSAATRFGQEIMVSFAAENVLLGITQEDKTGEVLNTLTGVLAAIQAASLYEVIIRIKAIPETDYDLKYITEARLVAFCNKIETYLGLPLTTEL